MPPILWVELTTNRRSILSIKVEDIMRENPIFCVRNQTLGHAHTLMKKNNISLMPVVDVNEDVIGVLSLKDLINNEWDESSKVETLMIKKVYTVPPYEKVNIAARILRNHHIHHLIVTHEKKLSGIVSSFDLLKLMENHRFVEKNPSTPKKTKGKRAAAESAQ